MEKLQQAMTDEDGNHSNLTILVNEGKEDQEGNRRWTSIFVRNSER